MMIIRVEHLDKTYEKRKVALKDISLTVENGVFGLLGPNGAGKTTLLRILVGLIRPTRGSVLVDGMDISLATNREHLHSILGYLPQELGLYNNLTAREFLDYFALMKGLSSSQKRRQKIEEVIRLVSLESEMNRRLATFSGGMKRRVGIAQALLGEPQMIVLDEPTEGLDPEERVRSRNMVSELGKSLLVILSSHVLEDISQTCPNLAILDRGNLLFSGDKRDLIATAEGKVWEVFRLENEPLEEASSITSRVLEGGMIRYHLLANSMPTADARPLSPSLEDAYLWMMKGKFYE
jgi:ABC-2 type transport system ATP-binding protein